MMPRGEFQRRAEQLEDTLELIKASGLRLVVSEPSDGTCSLLLVRGDYDEYATAAYLEVEQ